MFLTEVVTALRAEAVPFAVVGGYAVALHGAVRGTVDLDIVIALDEATYTATERGLRSIGLQPRLPVTAQEVFQFRSEYITRRNLVAWSFTDPRDPTRIVDVIITYTKKKLSTVDVNVDGTIVPILTKAELIKMKKKTSRPQDIEDIQALERLG